MHRVLRGVLILFVLALAALVAMPFALIDERPLVSVAGPLTPAQVQRARELLAELDPRRMREGDVRSIDLTDLDASLIANHVLGRWGGAAAVYALPGVLTIVTSVPLPPNPFGTYFNAQVGFADGVGFPAIERLRLGAVPLPRFVARALFERARAYGERYPALTASAALLDQVAFADGRLRIGYRWQSNAVATLNEALLPGVEVTRLREFHAHLADLLAVAPNEVRLPTLLGALFEQADRNEPSDIVADHRAVIVVLAAYVNGIDLTRAIPAAVRWPALPRVRVLAHGRVDLPQHFLTSAALAAGVGEGLAHALGLQKEVDDAAVGSGFSFVDLLADRAGTRFGLAATGADAQSARQRAIAARADSSWIPSPEGLEERMSAAEFQARYGAVGSARYESVIAEIDRRIEALPLWR